MTVGRAALEALQKEAPTRDPIELEQEMHRDYEKNIYECLERGKKLFSGDFYIVVEVKKERALQNVIRNYFFPRLSCPTPNTDQTVYKYHAVDDVIEFLWVVPAKDICQLLYDNALQVADDERVLLNFVLDYYDGTLLEMAKQLNGEKKDSILIDN